jgi:hypothetical protein
VFRQRASRPHLASVAPGTAPSSCEIVGRTDASVRVSLWDRAPCTLNTSEDKQLTVQADQLPPPQTLDGSWEVRFAPGRGAPESAVFDRLLPWNEHPLDGIKYFSGTATYRQTFQLEPLQDGRLVRLQLGEVKCIAQVRLNGQPLGVVWTDPWSVDLTPAVRAGANELEIDVTNLWVNRLIGDAGLPESQRVTKTNATRRGDETGRLAHLRGYLATDALQPSGLLGPVQIHFGQTRDVDF